MAGLDAQDFEVHPDVARAETLPADAFTSPAFAERERATLFRASWQLLPERTADQLREDPRSLADLVRRRGARAPVTLLDAPLFLQRDWQGTLRLFPNVCTHAWHTLVQGPERERHIVCPQHGRRFDAEGTFQSQPGFEGVKGFPRDCDSLQPMAVGAWGDLLFACLGAPAAPLDDVLGPVRESLGKLPFDKLERRPVDGEVREVEGNWKQHAWNYMDQLHIPYIHRKPGGLGDAVDLATYRTELFPHGALQWAHARDPGDGFPERALPERFRAPGKRVFALWWLVFPNLALNFYPWGLSINVWQPVQGLPTRTRFLWYQYAWDEAKYQARDRRWMLRETDDEDVDALTQVARGARSRLAVRGRFAPGAEDGPHWFHRQVYQAVFPTVTRAKPQGRR